MERFLTKVSNDHNIDTQLILSQWKQYDEVNTSYNKMKKPELVDLCKTKGFKSIGSKPELIGYLFDEVVDKPIDIKPITKLKQTATSSSILQKLFKYKIPRRKSSN